MEISSRVYQPTLWPSRSTYTQGKKFGFSSHLIGLLYGFAENQTNKSSVKVFDRTKTSTVGIPEDQGKKLIKIMQTNSIENVLNPTNHAHEQLRTIAKLEDDWNNNGAKAFSSQLINKVSLLIDSLPVVPCVFPTAIGAIQIEYNKQDGSYLEFEIYEDSVQLFMIDKDKQEHEKEIIEDYLISILQAVVDFYE